MVEGKTRPWIITCEEIAHIIADAGEALETAIAVQEFLNRFDRHLPLCQEIEQDTGIDLTAARAHGQPVERGEPHRAIHRAAVA